MNKNRLFYKWAATTIVTVGSFCCIQFTNAAEPYAREGHDFTTIPAGAEYKAGELLVCFAPKPDGKQRSLTEKNQILTSLGAATIKYDFKLPGLTLVKLPAGQTVKDALKTFNGTNGILYAEPDYKIRFGSTFPNDTRFNELWGLHNTGQTGGTPDADIDAPEAWDISTRSDIIVAVLDSGVDYTHPDLIDNMWINTDEIPDNGIDDDNNGYVDDIRGWDFDIDDGNDNDPMDEWFHGTHCAGIIGAVGDNNEGVTGICWNVKIMGLNISHFGEADWHIFVSQAIKGIRYAVDKGARILNASWGYYGYSQSLKDEIYNAGQAGALLITIAQNYGENIDVEGREIYPACYDLDNIICVMATDAYDNKPDFSNYGATSVDLGAPGTDILSCVLGGGYESWNGTSMAAPHVAGACALIWSIKPTLSHLQVKDIILNSVDQIPDLNGLCVTGGRLNLFNALTNTIALTLDKVDDINDGVVPGDYITYTISYANPIITDPCDPNYGDVNDVNIIDYLPDDVEPNNPFDPNYNPSAHTYTWQIGTLNAGAPEASVSLTVKVNECISACGTITNSCKIEGKAKGGNWTRWAWASENTPVCSASNPNPTCREIIVDLGAGEFNLTWCPGRFAADVNGHEVYFGSNFNDVHDANNSWPLGRVYKGPNTNPSYPLTFSDLDLDTTYYWRIDEVNTNHPDVVRWRGGVWSFKTGNYFVVENFNSYAQTGMEPSVPGDLKYVWKDYETNNSGAIIYLQKGNTDANLVRDGNSMKYDYGAGQRKLSEAYANTTALPSGIGSNWKVSGVKALSLWFYGKAGNDANEQMYVKLTDSASKSAKIIYDGDADDVREAQWHEWNIALQEFVDACSVLNLANVSRITIGFGNGTIKGTGRVYFDDIRLYLERCIPGYYPAGDFESDCDVDFYDFAIFAQAWLTSSGQPDYNPVCDISVPCDGIINKYDLARFCDDWLWQEGGKTMSMMSSGFSEALYTTAPPQQPQIELQPEPEPQLQVQSAPELLQPEPQPQPEPPLEPQLTKEDIQELIDRLEELWLTNEEVRSTCTKAEWLEFIETVRQTPVE